MTREKGKGGSWGWKGAPRSGFVRIEDVKDHQFKLTLIGPALSHVNVAMY